MVLRSPISVAALVLLAAPLALARPAQAQGEAALELLVREAGTARPLAEATVRVVRSGQFGLTDSTGHALLLRLPEGRTGVEVRHPGHAPRTVELELAGGAITQVVLPLEVRPIELEGVEVTVEAQAARLRRAGFYHRERVYSADFVHAEELALARMQGRVLSGILRGRRGISVQPGPGGGHVLVSSRSRGLRACAPAVFVDGLRQYGITDIDRLLPLMDVDAIEIYAGRVATPLEFTTRDTCGAVVIWTPGGR